MSINPIVSAASQSLLRSLGDPQLESPSICQELVPEKFAEGVMFQGIHGVHIESALVKKLRAWDNYTWAIFLDHYQDLVEQGQATLVDHDAFLAVWEESRASKQEEPRRAPVEHKQTSFFESLEPGHAFD